MFLKFTEAKSQNVIAVNTDHVVGVFVAPEGEMEGKTIINLVNGMLAIDEDLLTVLGQLAAV